MGELSSIDIKKKQPLASQVMISREQKSAVQLAVPMLYIEEAIDPYKIIWGQPTYRES